MSYSKVILIGNLTRDPELRTLPAGTNVGQFTVAVNRKFKDAQGALKEEVSFVDCEAWGSAASNVAKFFTKGTPIFVEGRIKQDTWEDKASGQKRSRLKVVVESWQFVGGKRDNAPAPAPASDAGRTATVPGGAEVQDDVPFY